MIAPLRCTLTLTALLLLPSYAIAEWVEVKNSVGIQVYTKEIPGSPIIMAKGVTIIDAKPKAILEVLDNNKEHPKWIPYLQESRQLQPLSDTERLEYNLFNAPWPASNRDFVYRVKETPSGHKNILIYSMKSEPNPLMPEQQGIVRGLLYQSTFRLTELKSGKTEVELLFQADPQGWIPTWIVNIFQKAWPYKVLEGLRTRTLSIEL